MESRVLLSQPPQLITPIEGVAYRDWTITNYLDMNPARGAIADYRGGSYTYDGHTGIDYALEDFAQMDAGVKVYAAAAGAVAQVQDGAADRNVQRNASAPANYVIVDHGGGWQTWYWHLRKGSVAVAPGQQVKAGQVLGLVGSSGDSNGPHLHFEVRYNGQPVEPFQNPRRYWDNSLPYAGNVPGVLGMGISSRDPKATLDQKERPATVTSLTQGSGQRVYAWVWAHSLKDGDRIAIEWYRPNGSSYSAWSSTQRVTQTMGWWEAWIDLPDQPDVGTWQAVFRINGTEYARSSLRVLAKTSVGGIDFGAAQSAAITGYVFNDANANGRWNKGEKGLKGRQVFLDLNGNETWDRGEPLAKTNGKGRFRFAGVAPGAYAVRQILPAGWRQTLPRDAVYQVSVTRGQAMRQPFFGNTVIA